MTGSAFIPTAAVFRFDPQGLNVTEDIGTVAVAIMLSSGVLGFDAFISYRTMDVTATGTQLRSLTHQCLHNSSKLALS